MSQVTMPIISAGSANASRPVTETNAGNALIRMNRADAVGAKNPADQGAERAITSPEQIRNLLADMNTLLANWSISIRFQIDPDYKDVIIQVVDAQTGEQIRQIPAEEVVRMTKMMDRLKGLLIEETA